MPTITPSLWFDTQAKEAVEFYTSVFPNSKITDVSYYGDAGPGELPAPEPPPPPPPKADEDPPPS